MKGIPSLRFVLLTLAFAQALSISLTPALHAQSDPLFYDFGNYVQSIENFAGEGKIRETLSNVLFRTAYGSDWKKLELEPRVASVATGAFTEQNTRQTLVVVDHGWHGPGAGQLGAHIFILDQSGRVVVHESDYPATGDVLNISDLDEDGLSEVLLSEYQEGMGYLNVMANLWSFGGETFEIVHPFGEMLYSDCAASGREGTHHATLRIHRNSHDLSGINWTIAWTAEDCTETDF